MIHHQFVKVNQDGRPASLAELVVELLACEAVVLEVVVALVEDDVFALGVDVDVAVLGADTAIALGEG